MTDIFRSQLLSIKQNMGKNGKKTKAADYFMDNSDSEGSKSGEDSFDNIDAEGAEQMSKFLGAEGAP